MSLIVTKVLTRPPKDKDTEETRVTGECAFVDGITSDLYNNVHLKINKMTAGKYLVFYTAKFRKENLCRRLNTIFYSPFDIELKKRSARKFGDFFLAELTQKNFKRQCAGEEFY